MSVRTIKVAKNVVDTLETVLKNFNDDPAAFEKTLLFPKERNSSRDSIQKTRRRNKPIYTNLRPGPSFSHVLKAHDDESQRVKVDLDSINPFTAY